MEVQTVLLQKLKIPLKTDLYLVSCSVFAPFISNELPEASESASSSAKRHLSVIIF